MIFYPHLVSLSICNLSLPRQHFLNNLPILFTMCSCCLQFAPLNVRLGRSEWFSRTQIASVVRFGSCSNAIYPWQMDGAMFIVALRRIAPARRQSPYFSTCFWVPLTTDKYNDSACCDKRWYSECEYGVPQGINKKKANVWRMMMIMLDDNKTQINEMRREKRGTKIYGFATAYVNSRLWHKSFQFATIALRLCQRKFTSHLWNEKSYAVSVMGRPQQELFWATKHSGIVCNEMTNDQFASARLCAHTHRARVAAHANASEFGMLIKLSQSWHFRDACRRNKIYYNWRVVRRADRRCANAL